MSPERKAWNKQGNKLNTWWNVQPDEYFLHQVSINNNNNITSRKPGRQCQCLFQWPATSYCHQRSGPSRLAGTDPSNSDTATAVCVCGVCARVARVRSCVCVCACVMCLQYTIIIFDPR